MDEQVQQSRFSQYLAFLRFEPAPVAELGGVVEGAVVIDSDPDTVGREVEESVDFHLLVAPVLRLV
jgi:hypothetical protein